MRVFASLSFFVFIGMQSSAADSTTVRRQDRLIVDFFHDNWLVKPDSVITLWSSHGVSVSAMYDHPLGRGNISLAIGAAFTSHNVRNNAYIITQKDTAGSTNSSLKLFADGISNKLNKLSTNYIDIPAELRFRLHPGKNGLSFKGAVGLRAGYIINVHSTRVTDEGRFKSYIFPDIAKYRYGVHARLAYGKVGVMMFYSLSSVFEKNRGPEIIPFSAGISVMPF